MLHNIFHVSKLMHTSSLVIYRSFMITHVGHQKDLLMLENQLATTSAGLLLIKCVLIASVIDNVSYPKILAFF